MKLIKVFLPPLLLILLSLCPFLPREQSTEPTHSTETKIIPQIEKSDTPRTIVETPPRIIPEGLPSLTPKTPEVVPSPTSIPLIPGNLGEITVKNIQNLEVIGEIPYPTLQPDHLIYFLGLSNDGAKLIVKSENMENRKKALVVWDLISNSQLLEISNSPYPIIWASFSPDNDQLWVIREEFIDQYNLEQGILVNTLDFPEYTGGAISISPDGKYIVTGFYHGSPDTSTIHFYNFGSAQPIHSKEMAFMIMSFCFSPDSKMVSGISAKIGGTVTKIWDVESGVLMKDLYNYDSGPVFSTNSKLAAFVKGNDFSVFSTESWVLEDSFQNKNPYSTNFPRFFLGDNQILAIKETVSVTFNDINTGEELLELPSQVTIVNYSPILKVIFTNSNLETIKLWGILQ